MRKCRFLFIFLTLSYWAQCQNSTSELLEKIRGKDSLVDFVLSNQQQFRLQFIVSEIKRDSKGNTSFTDFPLLTGNYFYPASLVKLPTAIITGELLDSLNLPLDGIIKMNHDVQCGSSRFVDQTIQNNLTFRLVLEDMLAISNNDYFTLLFHFLGPKNLNDALIQKNILNTKIYSSYSGCDKKAPIQTNSYTICNNQGQKIYSKSTQNLAFNEFEKRLPYSADKLVGSGHFSGKKLIRQPFDFNYAHDYSLSDIHHTMKRLIFPQLFPIHENFKLSENTRNFLIKSMGKFPREMTNTLYHDSIKYPDNYYKYSIFGEDRLGIKSDRYRTISKIGISYGFVTETAYIIDLEKKKDFLLSISIYVNRDGILNDGKYEYENVARPFISRFSLLLSDYFSGKPENGVIPATDLNKLINTFYQAK